MEYPFLHENKKKEKKQRQKNLFNITSGGFVIIVTNTIFPHIVSAETILFSNLEIVENSNSNRKFQFFT